MPPRKRKSSPAPPTSRAKKATGLAKTSPAPKKTATAVTKPPPPKKTTVAVPKCAAPTPKKVVPTPKPANKRPLEIDSIDLCDDNEDECPPPTSQAHRQRKRYKLTRGTLWREPSSPEDIEALALLLASDSPSHSTWGSTSAQPIVGNKRKSRKSNGFRLTSNGGGMMTWSEMMEDMALSTRKSIIPNCYTRSPILRLPLEVRERIYGYVLKYEKPILLKPDWKIPERNAFSSHALLKTCKQFAHECTSFFYKNNTFQALLRPSTSRQLIFDDVPLLPASLHHLFRHVVLDFAKECWSIDWFEKDYTMTLVLSPKRVGMSTTAMGMQANPVAFTDLLWDGGAVMQAISKLCPRTLKVVVKKQGKRFGFEVDMRCLQALMGGHWEGANVVGIQMAEDRAVMVREELAGLRERFEEVFEDDETAVLVGRCRVLGEEENAARVFLGVVAGGESGTSGVGSPAVAMGEGSASGSASQEPFERE